MKRIITTLFAAVLLYAGKTSATDLIPVPLMQSFFETFTNAQDVKWEKRNGYNIASFTRDNIKQSAVYSELGQLIAVARQLSEKEVPEQLKADLAKRFKGYFATTIFEMKDDSGINYFATVTNGSKEKILKASKNKWISLKEKNL
jgi:hypothetical protein